MRPKNLNLFTIRFPIPAIVSILHRISGFCLFILIPFILWGLDYSLTEDGFTNLQQYLDIFAVKLLVWLLLIPFCFHLIAGLRHLLMDVQVGVSLQSGRTMAKWVFIVSFVCIVLAGIWLW